MVKHNTIDEAEQEAIRIATKERTPVHVLQHVSTCTATVKIEWEYPEVSVNPDCMGCGNKICTCYNPVIKKYVETLYCPGCDRPLCICPKNTETK